MPNPSRLMTESFAQALPNPRMQRTPSAPLMRKPLGAAEGSLGDE